MQEGNAHPGGAPDLTFLGGSSFPLEFYVFSLFLDLRFCLSDLRTIVRFIHILFPRNKAHRAASIEIHDHIKELENLYEQIRGPFSK